MRDEENAFDQEAADRDRIAKLWAKIRKPRLGIESISQIRGVATLAEGEKAVWHFPPRKRYFGINRSLPNNWGLDS